MTLAPFAGFIGTDIQLQETTNSAVARFRIAITDRFRNDKGNFVERETFWVTCQAWGALARRIVAEVGKGDAVVLLGRWEQSTYEKEGEKKTARFVTVEHLGVDLAIPSKKDRPAAQESAPAETPSVPAEQQEVENPL